MSKSLRKRIAMSLLVLWMMTFTHWAFSEEKEGTGRWYKTNDKDLIEVSKLRKMGKPGVEPLIAKLKHEKARVRNSTALALGLIGDARAVTPLVATLKDEDEFVRTQAAMALGRIGDAHAVEHLIGVLEDKSRSVRMGAARALGKIRDSRAVEPLIALLEEENEGVRSVAASALAEIGDPSAVHPLKAALQDNHALWAATALYQLNCQKDEQMERLITALNDQDPLLRRKAAWALPKTKDARAVRPLIAALKDEDTRFQSAAKNALWNLTGENFGQDHQKWQKWWEQNKQTFKPEAVAYDFLGLKYRSMGRYQEAVKAYEKATRIKPNYADAHYGLGLAYFRLGDNESAREQYEILKTLDQKLANKLLRWWERNKDTFPPKDVQ